MRKRSFQERDQGPTPEMYSKTFKKNQSISKSPKRYNKTSGPKALKSYKSVLERKDRNEPQGTRRRFSANFALLSALRVAVLNIAEGDKRKIYDKKTLITEMFNLHTLLMLF